MKKINISFIILLLIISFFSAFYISFKSTENIEDITIEAIGDRNIFAEDTSVRILGVFIDK